MGPGYFLVGTIVGIFAFAIALLLGVSFLPALMIYSGAGAVTVIALLVAEFLFGGVTDRPSVDATSGNTGMDAHPQPSDQDHQAKIKILVVDDDLSLLDLLSMIAADAGFAEVITASSAAAALDAIEKADTAFDCFLLDVRMPQMDGIELSSRIRKIPDYSDTPIIMLTAMRDMEFMGRAYQAGASEYATKPIDVAELSDRLREAHKRTNSRTAPVRPSMALADETAERKALNTENSVGFESVAGFVDLATLESYLTRLSRSNLERVHVYAIKVEHWDRIHALAPSERLASLVRKTAGAIAAALKTIEPVAAYAGNGTFIIISGAEKLGSSRIAEIEIKNRLRDIHFEDKSGVPIKIGVSIGGPAKPEIGSEETQAETAFGKAISYAESRELDKKGERTLTVVQ